mmetsp:Transcript_4922/g.22241  ORF Transcript_4922/g.22241 Transcript_4922/m.22241 type:complete len:201 (+) Transcript_4922:1352-1954(+)
MNTPPGDSASWIVRNIFFNPLSPQFSWIHFVTDKHRNASTEPGGKTSSRKLPARKVTPPSDGPESASCVLTSGFFSSFGVSSPAVASTRVAGCDLSVPPATASFSFSLDAAASAAASSSSRTSLAACFAAARRIRLSFSLAFFTSQVSMSMPSMVVDPNWTAMDSDTRPSLHPMSTHRFPWNHSRLRCAMRWSSSDSPTR